MRKVTFYGTLGQAKKEGYKTGRTQYERGYISRKTIIDDDDDVYVSGDGWLFYYKPCYHTTQYVYRQYLYPKYI